MPLISTKGAYGLVAMYELSIHTKESPLQIREISTKANIPQNYLEQLLSKLRQAGLVKSTRGAKGGYVLAKDAKEIQIIDILVCLEGDLRLIDVKAQNPILNLFFNDKKKELAKIFKLNLANINNYQDKYNELLHYNI